MSHRFFLSRLPLLVFAVLLALFLSAPLVALAEPEWKASLGVGQEYSDNTGEEKNGKDDFITSVRPSLAFAREGERLQFQSAYSGDYRFYAKGTEDQEFNHNLNAHALLDAWDSFLFLDMTDTYRLVNEDRTEGDALRDNPSQGLSQDNPFTQGDLRQDNSKSLVQQNTFTFSPTSPRASGSVARPRSATPSPTSGTTRKTRTRRTSIAASWTGITS